MTRARSPRAAGLARGGAAVLVWLVAAAPAFGQEVLRDLMDPELGALGLRSDYRITIVPEQPVAGQPAELGMTQHDVNLTAPVHQGPRDEWAASVRLRRQDFDTRAVLPDSGDPFPDELWRIRVGASYRHRFDRGWIGAGHLAVGSPSDRPFASADELEVSLTGVLRVPRGQRDAWLFFLNYSNTREFLRGVPLPGLGYAYSPSESLDLVLSTGWVSVQYRPIETVTLIATYVAIRTVDLRVMYQVARPVRLWVGFDWTNERYLRADREDPDDTLFYYEKRLRAGAIVGLARQLYVELSGGYTFDRFYFEGESYSDRGDDRVDVGSGPFAQVRLGVRF